MSLKSEFILTNDISKQIISKDDTSIDINLFNNKEENNYILNNVVWFNPKQSTITEKITVNKKKKINFDKLERMINYIIANKN
jgi:hypothetical protein